MLQVIQFENGLYGLRNSWTGIVLCHRSGRIRTFRFHRFAERKAMQIEKKFNHTISSISKNY